MPGVREVERGHGMIVHEAVKLCLQGLETQIRLLGQLVTPDKKEIRENIKALVQTLHLFQDASPVTALTIYKDNQKADGLDLLLRIYSGLSEDGKIEILAYLLELKKKRKAEGG